MGLQHAWATSNLLTSLGVTAFTWSDASGNVANRSFLNDGLLYKQLTLAAVVTTVNVVIDLGSAQSVSFASVLNHNLRLAGGTPTLKVEGADDAAISVNVVVAKATTNLYRSTGLDEPRDRDHVLQFTAVSKRYWRLTFAWTGSFALSVGELYMGVSTALTRFSQLGSIGDDEEYKLSQVELGGGDVRAHVLAGPIRTHAFRVDDLALSERQEVMRMWRASSGGGGTVLFINEYEVGGAVAPDDYQDVVLGRLEQRKYSWKEYDFARYSTPGLTIRSLGREMGA